LEKLAGKLLSDTPRQLLTPEHRFCKTSGIWRKANGTLTCRFAYRFVKPGTKGAVEKRVTIGEHTTRIPARPYTMGAIRDGWLIFSQGLKRPPRPAVIDQLCVSQLADGRCLLRFVKKGRRAESYDLISVTGPAILDVALEWAEPVVAILPFEPSEDQMLALQGDASA